MASKKRRISINEGRPDHNIRGGKERGKRERGRPEERERKKGKAAVSGGLFCMGEFFPESYGNGLRTQSPYVFALLIRSPAMMFLFACGVPPPMGRTSESLT